MPQKYHLIKLKKNNYAMTMTLKKNNNKAWHLTSTCGTIYNKWGVALEIKKI